MPTADEAAPVSAPEAARLFADLAVCPALVLAVSGGPDSTALLVLAARWRDALGAGPKLLAVTVDHGLRPESGAEAEAVKRLAGTLGVPHRTLHWIGAKPAAGLQQAARAARYRLLAAAAHEIGARHILTAHTLDDQAETVLMRMARGSGLTGLAGMARMTPLDASFQRSAGATELVLVRPLLDIPKVRLIATLAAAGIAFAEDPSNRDPRFTRVRMRALLPALAAEGLDASRLALLSRRMARAEAALEAAVDAAFARLSLEGASDRRTVLDAAGFAALPAEVALRLVGRAIARLGDEGPVELGKLEALFGALTGSVRTAPQPPRFRRTLAGALVTLDAGRLVVERAPARRRIDGNEATPGGGTARPGKAHGRPIVKEIRPIPLADGPVGLTLAQSVNGSSRIAGTISATGVPARRKGRK